MKLSGADAARFCRSPQRGIVGALIHGEDAALVAQRRDALLSALLGAGAGDEMRLTTMSGAEARTDPARVDEALRSVGFFPGPRATLVTGATDGLAPIAEAALAEAAGPGAFLVMTADVLGGKSALRAVFEAARNAVSAPCYAEMLDRRGVAEALAEAGLSADEDALALLEGVAAEQGPAPFTRFLETLSLYSDGRALSADDIAALRPQAGEGDADAAVDAALAGDVAVLRAQLARLAARGTSPVEIVLAAQRRFRSLLGLAVSGGRPSGALMRLPPFVRERLAAQARRLGAARLERALSTLLETDAALRGGSSGPAGAILERALLRIAADAER